MVFYATYHYNIAYTINLSNIMKINFNNFYKGISKLLFREDFINRRQNYKDQLKII